MEPNWLIIIPVLLAAVLLIVFLVWRNQKDQKELTKNIIDKDEASIPKQPDAEIEATE